MTLIPLRRPLPDTTIPVCDVCNGEGENTVVTHDGRQTPYSLTCPHCSGFGKAMPSDGDEA